MKKGAWLQGCLMGLVLLLAGCGKSVEGTDGRLREGLELLNLPEISEVPDISEEMEEPEQNIEVSLEEMIYVPKQVTIEGNDLKFGHLVIHFPKEASVHMMEPAEEKGQVLEVTGLGEGKAAPPRIRLAYYHVGYEKEIELASAILKEISGEILSVVYASYDYKRGWDYGFEIEDEIYRRYLLVRGKEVCLLEEVSAEEDYSVSALLKELRVGWIISGKEDIISYNDRGERESYDHKYLELRPEDGVRWIATFGGYRDFWFDMFLMYQEGDYEAPCENLFEGTYVKKNTEDLNFDGYEDLRLGRGWAYLWNHERQCYTEVLDYMEGIPFDIMNVELFEEEKTLYSVDWNWLGDAQEEEREYLWQWEGCRPILKRECILEVSADTVSIRVQEDNGKKVLANHTVSRNKWEENKEILRPYYEQFYKGLAPQGTYELKHGVKKKQKYISGDLLNKIARVLESREASEALKPLAVGRILTDEEICNLARECMDIRVDLAEVVYQGSYTMLEADIDNDGILDLLAEKYWGGSGGFVDCILYQGQKEGGYVRTSCTSQLIEEFACISYEGKNYLCRTTYNYKRKINNGVALYYYEKGQLAEDKYVELVPDSYQVRTLSGVGEQWMVSAEKTAAESMKYRERIEDYEILIGSAEQEGTTEEENCYLCDLDNDGEMEEYEKRIWTTSSMSSVEHLSFSGDGEKLIGEMMRNEGNPPIMLWVDKENGENIIKIMYLTGLYDYEVVGYLANGDEYEQVYRIQGKARLHAKISG